MSASALLPFLLSTPDDQNPAATCCTEDHVEELRQIVRQRRVDHHDRTNKGWYNLLPWSIRAGDLDGNDFSLLWSFLKYILHAFKTVIVLAVFSPVTLYSSPVSTVATIFTYTVVFTLLWLLLVSLWVLGLLGGYRLVDWVGNHVVGTRLSSVNWLNPDLFASPQSQIDIDNGRVTLSADPSQDPVGITTIPPDLSSNEQQTTRVLDISVAKTLLLFSALIYERIDQLVVKAGVDLSNDSDMKQNSSKQQSENEKQEKFEEEGRKKAKQTLTESEKIIRNQALKWGLKFQSLSDLGTLSGPFAGAFYATGDNPFVVLTFKGTTPTDYSEFLVDATINRVSAAVMFGSNGTVHEGFYNHLFLRPRRSQGGVVKLLSQQRRIKVGDNDDDNNDGSKNFIDPYSNIIQQLKRLAIHLQAENDNKPIPLWVTGHSLGSALASLMFARLLHSPDDLTGVDRGSNTSSTSTTKSTKGKTPYYILRDCYCFGTPRLGDGNFASTFESYLTEPLDRPNILFRIVNGQDVVCQVPPGLTDRLEKRGSKSVGDNSILDYSHLQSVVLNIPTHSALRRLYNLLTGSPSTLPITPAVRDEQRSNFNQRWTTEASGLYSSTKVFLRFLSPFSSSSLPLRSNQSHQQEQHHLLQHRGQAQRYGALSPPPPSSQNLAIGLLNLIPNLLFNHFPASYYDSLNRIQPKINHH